MKVNVGAAFVEGFRVIAREPLSLVGWALAIIGYYVAQFLLGMITGGGMAAGMMANMSKIENGQIDSSVIGSMALIYIVGLAIGLVFYAIMASAMFRAVTDPGGSRAWARLRVTGAELILALTLLLVIIVAIVWTLVTVAICAVLIRTGGLGGVLGFFVGAFSAFSFASLFALVGPMTIDRGRFSLVEAVGVAAREFWRLMGLNLLLFLLAVGIYIVLLILTLAFMGGTFASMRAGGDPAQVQQAMMNLMLSPVTWIMMLVVLPVVSVAIQVLFVTPAARAYVDAAGSTSSQVDAFS